MSHFRSLPPTSDHQLALERLASAVVARAIAPYRTALSSNEVRMLHFVLEAEILFDPAHRSSLDKMLEAAAAAPRGRTHEEFGFETVEPNDRLTHNACGSARPAEPSSTKEPGPRE